MVMVRNIIKITCFKKERNTVLYVSGFHREFVTLLICWCLCHRLIISKLRQLCFEEWLTLVSLWKRGQLCVSSRTDSWSLWFQMVIKWVWMLWSVLVIRYCFYQRGCVCKHCVFVPKIATYGFYFRCESFILCARFDQGIKVKIKKVLMCESQFKLYSAFTISVSWCCVCVNNRIKRTIRKYLPKWKALIFTWI